MGAISTSPIIDNNVQPFVIYEDSNLLKTICCIPLVGLVTSLFIENSLKNKLNQTLQDPKLIELINIKIEYQVANAVRDLLSAALVVAGIALGIIASFALGAVVAGIFIALAGLHIYQIKQNKQFINQLNTSE